MKRFTVVPLVLVFTLLAVAPAAAAPPVTSAGTFSYDSEPIPGLCADFPVHQWEVGTYDETYFYDKAGNLIRVQGHYQGTDEWYNYNDPAKVLSGPFNGIIIWDLRTGVETAQGLSTGITVPGYGTVLMWAGRFFQYPGGRYVGKYSPADATDREQVCKLLASD